MVISISVLPRMPPNLSSNLFIIPSPCLKSIVLVGVSSDALVASSPNSTFTAAKSFTLVFPGILLLFASITSIYISLPALAFLLGV